LAAKELKTLKGLGSIYRRRKGFGAKGTRKKREDGFENRIIGGFKIPGGGIFTNVVL